MTSANDSGTGARLPVVLVAGQGPWAQAVADCLAELGLSSPARVDVDEVGHRVSADPRPAVAVLADADPGDRALVACLAAGVPVVDVHRSIASVDRARQAMRAGTLVAAVGWAGGVPALVAAEHALAVGGPVEHVEIDVLLGPGDRAGTAWWRRFTGLHRSFMVYDQGQRRLVRGLGEPKVVEVDGRRLRARRIASPEQETLVESGRARSAAVRVAFARFGTNFWLALLVGSGAWRFVPVAVRAAVLRQPAGDDPHEVRVTSVSSGRVVRARVVDPRGRAHMVAAGAVVQVKRLLDGRRAVPAGVSHPEEADDLVHDLAALRALGVVIVREEWEPPADSARVDLEE